MPNSKPSALPAESFQFRRGAELAIQLLEECEADTDVCERCELTSPIHTGMPQRNIALEYLTRAQAAGPEVVDGFTRILSDIIATLGEGGVPDSSMYRDRRKLFQRLARQYARDGVTHG